MMSDNQTHQLHAGNQLYNTYSHMLPAIYDNNKNVVGNAVVSDCRSPARQPVGEKTKNVQIVARRNARERRRIKHVNSAFDDLRKRVPTGNDYRKISKVETLRSAIEYIKALEAIVERQKNERDSPTLHVTSPTNNSSPTLDEAQTSPWQVATPGDVAVSYPVHAAEYSVAKVAKDFPHQKVETYGDCAKQGDRIYPMYYKSNPEVLTTYDYNQNCYGPYS